MRRVPPRAYTQLAAADPALGAMIERDGRPPREPSGRDHSDHYGALLRTIIGQQLSTLAARAIYGRVLAYFKGKPPTPRQILKADAEELRLAGGLSRAKTGYLRSLAEHVLDGSLQLDQLGELSDDEVIAELTAVKGIGEWSAHMFLMFQLERPDIMAPGDLGIRKGIQLLDGLPEMPTPAAALERAEVWRPWRTVACLVLWHALDATPA